MENTKPKAEARCSHKFSTVSRREIPGTQSYTQLERCRKCGKQESATVYPHLLAGTL